MGTATAQTPGEISTVGAELMDSTHEALIGVLRSIRDQADSVLKGIEHGAEQKSLAWKCTGCGYTKHFTRPAPANVAAPCPKCGAGSFQPV